MVANYNIIPSLFSKSLIADFFKILLFKNFYVYGNKFCGCFIIGNSGVHGGNGLCHNSMIVRHQSHHL